MPAAIQPIRRATAHGFGRYPSGLVERFALADGRGVLIRPVVPQDAAQQQQLVRSLSPQSSRWRFHGPVRELPEAALRYMTDIDYVNHLALLAEYRDGGGARQIAEARWVRRTDEAEVADFAIVVLDDFQRRGLGTRLLQRLIESAHERGVQRLYGDVLDDNGPMRKWLQTQGWRLSRDRHDASNLIAERSTMAPLRLAA